jgi:carboxyl-terminal processing protease
MFTLLLFSVVLFFSPVLSEEQKVIQDPDEVVFHWIGIFAETVDLIQKKHYKPENIEDAMKKSIKSFVSTFDPHSSFLDAENYKELMDSTSGIFYGIGIVIDNTRREKDKALLVVDVIDGGPADQVGIVSTDKIMEVDGKPLEGLSTEKIITMIKGEKNTKVELKILRDNAPDLLTFTVTRDAVKEQQSLCFLLKDQDIYYLALTMFSDLAMQQMERLLKMILKGNNCRGLIIDLRNNSGGLLSSVLDIASLFLPKGSPVVHTKNGKEEMLSEYKTEKNPLTTSWQIPIIILINNYTASAAEILAGTLKYYARNPSNNIDMSEVYLLGEKTFGKGSVQEIIPLQDCAIKLTTTLYFLPDGKTIQGIGIEPDIMVKRTTPETEQSKWFTLHYGREEILANTISVYKKENEKNEKKKEKPKKSRSQERIEKLITQDNQLQEAVRVIKIVNQQKQKTGSITDILFVYQPMNVDFIEEIK